MFDWIKQWITEIFTTLINFFGEIWEQGRKWFLWGSGIVLTVIQMIQGFVDWVEETMTRALEKVGELVAPDEMGSVGNLAGELLGTANTFFPVEEGFAMLVSLSALVCVCATIRIIKSWIPTVS